MNFSPRQRHQQRRWLAALLLAVYGTAGVLGYGLHAVWHCDHCHHVSEAAGGYHDGHDGHGHNCDPTGRHVFVSEDDCSICAFLAQAQSEHAGDLPVLCTSISPADPPASEFSDLPPLVRLHLARGPPVV